MATTAERFAVRLTAEQDALIRRAAEVEGPGFYALPSVAAERAGTPGRARRNILDPVLVIALSGLAIDCKEQGKGLGAQLQRDAITRAVGVAEIIGLRKCSCIRCMSRHGRSTLTSRFRALANRPAAPADVDQRCPRPTRPAAEVTG